MAFRSGPDDSTEAEKARYRQKLAEWRAMGFDVSALEVLLETDFEKFKEKRFELMRRQIHGAGPAPAAPQTPEAPAREAPGPAAVPRRPGLHSHFTGLARQPEAAPPPAGAPAPQERLHSEMRYPAARRRRPETEVRTFSVATERRSAPRGISVGEGGRPSAPAGAAPLKKRKPAKAPAAPAAPRPGRPEPPAEEAPGIALEDAGEEPEVAVEEEEAPGRKVRPDAERVELEEEGNGESAEERPAGEAGEDEGGEAAGEEAPEEAEEQTEQEEPPEAEAGGEEEPSGEEAPEEEPRPFGYFEPATRVPMKRREGQTPRSGPGDGLPRPVVKKKLRKGQPRPAPEPAGKSRGWIAAAVVIVVIVSALAGYYYLAPKTAVAARAGFPATAEAGALITFDGGNSTTTGKGIDRYSWSFGDGASAKGKLVGHYYAAAGTYTVSLTVHDQDGTSSAPYKSRITVSPLTVTVPPKRLDDRGSYAVNGTADVRNTDTYLYKVNVGGQQVTVSEIQLDLAGAMTQWVRAQLPEEDGFNRNHNALWTTTDEALSLSGKATTSLSSVFLTGDLNYTEESFCDAASGDAFQIKSRAVTHLRSTLIAVPFSINSTDTVRSYPGVAGISTQFQPGDIYRGRTFSQSDSQADGSYRSGNTTYYWSRMGVRNIGGFSSIGLNITAEKAYLDQNGFTEFHLNVWISSAASLPTSTLIHVRGRSGDTTFYSDHLAEMTAFKTGSGAVDATPQAFDPAPLPPELFYSPFNDVIASGSTNASLRFTPEQALQEAQAKDGSFRDFLASNPQAYACAGKYYEGQFGPGSATWNLTFSWPNATSSYWVNVTRDILTQYTVHGAFGGGLSQVRSTEEGLSRMLSLTSAEERMRSDADTNRVFFKDGSVNWAGGTSLEPGADSMYPSVNLASLYASPERAGYAVVLRKGADASAFSTDTGQMMYFYTHTGS
jgi:PKD repeat protein